MAFELPNLDQRTYDQLVAELIRHIPQYTTQWTDYNDSDPGITLIQLLAWIDESLLYQANQLPLETQQNFLRWVLGLAFSDNQTVYSEYAKTNNDYAFLSLQAVLKQLENGQQLSKAQLQQQVLDYVDTPYAALTLADTQLIALQTNQVIADREARSKKPIKPTPLRISQAYARVKNQQLMVYVLSNQKPTYSYPPYPNVSQYIRTTTVKRKTLLIDPSADSDTDKQLLGNLVFSVQNQLNPRVLLGSAVVVEVAQFTAINLSVDLTLAANTVIDITLSALRPLINLN